MKQLNRTADFDRNVSASFWFFPLEVINKQNIRDLDNQANTLYTVLRDTHTQSSVQRGV